LVTRWDKTSLRKKTFSEKSAIGKKHIKIKAFGTKDE
jgi:hypothetical protein